MKLDRQFQQLSPVDGSQESYTAELIEGCLGFRIGRDSNDYPCLIVAPREQAEGPPLWIDARNLSVTFRQPCQVSMPDGLHTEVLTIARCKSHDPDLLSHFFSICESLIQALGNNPDESAVERSFRALLELFKALVQPPIATVMGLWAELLLIHQSRSPALAIAAWHSTPNDIYDFNDGHVRIEVKSSSRRQRIHQFSHTQLTPPVGAPVVVASMFAERSGDGESIKSLAEDLRQSLQNDVEELLRFETVIANSLGDALVNAQNIRFDDGLASASLQFFDVDSISKIANADIPVAVSSLRYSSDLSAVEQFRLTESSNDDGLVSNLINQQATVD